MQSFRSASEVQFLGDSDEIAKMAQLQFSAPRHLFHSSTCAPDIPVQVASEKRSTAIARSATLRAAG
jgi:hypothetical protein